MMPSRRGTLVVPIRRGVLVTPAEAEWIVQRCATDPTSGSLRESDLTGGSLRETNDANTAKMVGNLARRCHVTLLVRQQLFRWCRFFGRYNRGLVLLPMVWLQHSPEIAIPIVFST